MLLRLGQWCRRVVAIVQIGPELLPLAMRQVRACRGVDAVGDPIGHILVCPAALRLAVYFPLSFANVSMGCRLHLRVVPNHRLIN